MRILLIGEYSLIHNSLKEGLIELGHEVKIAGIPDGFKHYPVDYSCEALFSLNPILQIPRKAIYRLFNFDFANLEYGLRFYFLLPQLKNYDVVQFVNEAAIKSTKKTELFLIKKIVKNNNRCFLLSCGADYMTLKFYFENKNYKSVLQPFFQNSKLHKEFHFYFTYFTKGHIKIHNYIQKNFKGLIPVDFDYVDATKNYSIYKGFIPCPLNITKFIFKELIIDRKIVIFLGINKWSYNQKGIPYFEKALKIIQQKYEDKVEIIVTNTVPYPEYIKSYDKAHIVLDQAFSRDQGYNALEAMAKGKVVFTGMEPEVVEYYNLTERVCINAKADVDYLVAQLSYLIENPEEIIAIGKRARTFIETEHHYIKIAEKYLEVWKC
jgi:glycosyltransferase involved in cell wall biosynthesis